MLTALLFATLPTPELKLDVATFNLRFSTANDGPNSWPQRRELQFRVIREMDADILGLQECLDSQLEEILVAVPGYRALGVGRDDGKRAGEWSPILYRPNQLVVEESGTFWFSDTPEVPGSKSWGNSITRICTWARFQHRDTGRRFYVFNQHWDHVSQPSRLRSAELLAQRLARRTPRTPAIVMADFNAGPENPAVGYLIGAASPSFPGLTQPTPSPRLRNAYAEFHPSMPFVGTFHGFSGRVEGEMIDLVLTTPEFGIEGADIVRTDENGRYPSDHFPVLVRLRLP